jgi:hypothetical protein
MGVMLATVVIASAVPGPLGWIAAGLISILGSIFGRLFAKKPPLVKPSQLYSNIQSLTTTMMVSYVSSIQVQELGILII